MTATLRIRLRPEPRHERCQTLHPSRSNKSDAGAGWWTDTGGGAQDNTGGHKDRGGRQGVGAQDNKGCHKDRGGRQGIGPTALQGGGAAEGAARGGAEEERKEEEKEQTDEIREPLTEVRENELFQNSILISNLCFFDYQLLCCVRTAERRMLLLLGALGMGSLFGIYIYIYIYYIRRTMATTTLAKRAPWHRPTSP